MLQTVKMNVQTKTADFVDGQGRTRLLLNVVAVTMVRQANYRVF